MTKDEGAAIAAVDARFGWATDLLCELVRIPSITGDEGAAQGVVCQVMEDLGLEVDVWSPQRSDVEGHPSFSDDRLPLGERPVVVGHWDTEEDGAPRLVLNGHMDVVPAGDEATWSHRPWSADIADGRVYGRGSCDMKGGLVAGLLALAALRDAGLAPAVAVTFQSVIGEESGGVGTLAALLRGHGGDGAIVLEPTGRDICRVGAGAATFRLTVPGRAAHGAMRADGVNAIDKLWVLTQALDELEDLRHDGYRHPAYAPGELVAPISVGRVTAGEWPSSVPDLAVAEGRFGVLPGESLADARSQFEAAMAHAAEADPWLAEHRPKVDWFEGQFAPAETPAAATLVSVLADAHAAVHTAPPRVRGVPYGSDLRFFTNDAGIPAVLYGPGDVRLAHAADENVPLDEVRSVAQVLALTLSRPVETYS